MRKGLRELDRRPKPQGIKFDSSGSVEYQIFPEEYFAGSDVTVYFGDIFLSDITGLQFTLQEKVMPIFSYGSRTWDAVARGNRIVQGSFRIAFKEAGYLETIMGHIGQLRDKAKPALAYKMAGEEVPQWVADIKETIEDTLDRYHAGDSTKTGYNGDAFADKLPLGFGAQGDHVKVLREMIEKSGMVAEDPADGPYDRQHKFAKYVRGFGYDLAGATQVAKLANQKDKGAILQIQSRLNTIVKNTISKPPIHANVFPLAEDGSFGNNTKNGIIAVAKMFRFNQSVTEIESGKVPVITAGFVVELASMDLYAADRYSVDLFGAILRFQNKNGFQPTGVIDEIQLNKLKEAIGEKPQITDKGADSSKMATGSRLTAYEQEVWGRDWSEDRDRKYQTFFYSDRNRVDGIDWQEVLQETGFDVYITYGPSNEAVQLNNNTLPGAFNFNSTVKAIRNVQLTVTGQVLDATGQPIEEMYEFIARDLD